MVSQSDSAMIRQSGRGLGRFANDGNTIELIFERLFLLNIHTSLCPPASFVRVWMNTTKTGDAGGFKVPSTIPQDLLLIHDLVEGDLRQASSGPQIQATETNGPSVTRTTTSEEGDTDSIASSSSEDSLDQEGDVDMLKADALAKKEEVDKGADSEEEVEAGLLGGDGGGGHMTM